MELSGYYLGGLAIEDYNYCDICEALTGDSVYEIEGEYNDNGDQMMICGYCKDKEREK